MLVNCLPAVPQDKNFKYVLVTGLRSVAELSAVP